MRTALALLVVGLAGCDGCRGRPGPDPAQAAASTLREGEALASAVSEESGPPCARAHREITRLGAILDAGAPPEAAVFLAGCEALPGEVQVCLRPSHAAAHPEACAASIDALPAPQRATARDLARLR